jgi:bifunctional non-homologous end joining protein LigD
LRQRSSPTFRAERQAAKDTSAEILRVGRNSILLSNPTKLLFPAGLTKADVVRYYLDVSRYLLPHLKDRPVTLKRYPNGVGGEFFYEKDAPAFTPAWVKTFPVPRRRGGPDIRYIIINDRATLAWCASIANIEIHPFLHRVPALDTPTAVAFDLDPGEGADVLTCADVAVRLKNVLDQLGLQSFAKVSGSKGLQVYVPLNTGARYDQTQPFASQLARLLERQYPELVVADMDKHLRTGKVFIDWSQNADFKTTVAVYSLRAKRDQPFVSMPIAWSELQRALKKRSAHDLFFDPTAALRRVRARGDLFAPVLRLKQRLPDGFATEVDERRPRRRSAVRQPAAPAAPRRSHQGGRRRFVVEKDEARSIVRLETNTALKSWALPGAPPTRWTTPHRRGPARSPRRRPR